MRTRQHFKAAVSRCGPRSAGARSLIRIVVLAAVACSLLPATASAAQNVSPSVTPASIPNDNSTPATAQASVVDSTSAPVANEVITFAASGLSANFSNSATCTTDTSGTCSVQVTSGTPGSGSITATDQTTYSGQSASQPLAVIGPAAKIALSLTPSSITADGLSYSTATAVVKDSGNNPLAGESVGFTGSGTPVSFSSPSCVTDQTGTCFVTITGTSVGFTTITATDSAGNSPSTSKTLAETSPVPGHVTVQLNPSTILANGLSTTTAVATVTDANNHAVTAANVSFTSSDPSQAIGGVTNNGNGTYSVQIRGSTTVGSSTITATSGSVSGTATLIQAAGPSATTLVASNSSLVTNQGVTLVATVSSGTGAPSGTITFENGGVVILGCGSQAVSPSSPIATCQTAFAAAGSPARITAVFTPGPGSTAPGSTGSLNLSIGKDSTSVLLQIPSSATTGRAVTYSAQVSPPANRPGPIEPTGTVQFSDNGQTIASCASQPIVSGTATCTVKYKRAGAHSITAQYGGDANFSGSGAPTAHVSVVALRARIIGNLSDTMQWNFHFTSSYTRVLQLIVNGASPGDIIRVTCHGVGCPFTKHTTRIVKHKRCIRKHGKRKCSLRGGRTTLTVPLQGHTLSAGATFTVSITRRNWIGKYYSVIIRASRGPRIKISCLTPGYSKPGVGCSA